MSKTEKLEARPKTGGRKPGSPNKTTAATRARIEQESNPIGFLTRVMNGEAIKSAPIKEGEKAIAVYPTIDQRVSAARVLADKLIPNAKSRPIRLTTIPEIKTADDLIPALAAVFEAMALSEITPDEAATVASVLELKRRAVETVEMKRQLEEIEASLKRNQR